ncbi:MAG: energy transducer TonB [Betaproteobacteria bacterium]|nr:energy transducer TonB [Betaproteobacteria bacterium]
MQAKAPLSDSATLRQPPSSPTRWIRVAVQWLGVGLAHGVVLAAVLQASPPPPRIMPKVIQAGLIASTSLPAGLSEYSFQEERLEPPKLPPKPQQPKKSKPPKETKQKPPIPKNPKPLLAAASVSEEASASSYEVAQPSVEPSQSVPAATGSDSSASLALAPTSAGSPATGTLVAPIFNADYLENPPPAYPQLSRRRGETGSVLLRVYVSADGRAKRVEIDKSSGFERLDTAARNAVSGWRFVPARRGSEHVAAWVLVPISFVL